MSNGSTPKCPQCGAPLQENALAGLCPNCLMALNLKTETSFTGETEPAHPPLPVEEIAPHFPQLEILELLGRGGMGVVYKARQRTLNRLVALKLLAPERVGDPKFAERFAREAQALAALSHPNIVTIHDFGRAGGFFYLLMEFVDGVNLRQLLRARKFTPEEALAVIPPLCDALQFAHERGIVHRDIKPENLLLDKSGRVKIADFGIAKMLGVGNDQPLDAASSGQATQNALGTPGYSAPEQLAAPQRVDNRSDIFSLGVVFYEMLTGELPGKTIELPSKKVQIDVRLDEVVLRALEKNPEQRYQSAGVLKTQVETIVATPALSCKAGEKPPPVPRPESSTIPSSTPVNLSSPRLSRTAIVGLIGLFVSLIAAGVFALMMVFYRIQPSYGPTRVWFLTLVGFLVLASVMLGPVATTLLGWIAAGQIRRSVGKLYGMKLALFEGLLFPLLIGDGMLFCVWGRTIHNKPWFMLVLLVLLALDFFVVRGIWRKVQPSSKDVPAGKAAPNQSRSAAGIGWAIAGVFVVLVFLLIGAFAFVRHGGLSTHNGVLPAAPAPGRTSGSSTLDGVTTTTLSMDGNDQTDLFDPETGNISSVSKPSSQPQVLALLSQAGLVITRDRAENKTVLMGFGGYLPQTARSNQWDGLTDIQALQTLRRNSASAGVVVAAAATFPLPQTFFFKTPSQKIGVLQVTGFSENPRTVQVHYKFLDDKFIKEGIEDQSVEPAPQASKELWAPALAPGEKLDWFHFMDEEKKLAGQARYEDALQRLIWFNNHEQESGDSYQNIVRIGAMVSEWEELGRRYPKARTALLEVRDRLTRQLEDGRGYVEQLELVQSINRELQNPDATYELFKQLRIKDPKLASESYFWLEDLLLSRGEYQWCYDHNGGTEQRFKMIRDNLERQRESQKRMAEHQQKLAQTTANYNKEHGITNQPIPWPPIPPALDALSDNSKMMEKLAENNFVGETLKLIEILLGTNHKPEAEKIRDQAIALLDDRRLKTSVEDEEAIVFKRINLNRQ